MKKPQEHWLKLIPRSPYSFLVMQKMVNSHRDRKIKITENKSWKDTKS